MNSLLKVKLLASNWRYFNFKRLQSKANNVYSKTLNLPNTNFNLSMKNIYSNEEKIKKVSFYIISRVKLIIFLIGLWF